MQRVRSVRDTGVASMGNYITQIALENPIEMK